MIILRGEEAGNLAGNRRRVGGDLWILWSLFFFFFFLVT